MENPILLEASRWSELPDFIEQYNAMTAQEGMGRIFGYASIIGNHSAEKPAASTDLPNEKARVQGMEVAMNVYATGQYELRGTRDLENNIYNVGLYAGMEPALTSDGYSEGLNITVAPQDMAESFKAYVKREIGNPPGNISLDELFAQGDDGRIELTSVAQEHFATLKGTEQDDFGLYKLQTVATTKANGERAPALAVSTNENSQFSAIGLSPRQAAHYILDGQGYTREVDGRPLGGSALDYFRNTLASYEEYGLEQPRIRAIASEVVTLAEQTRTFHEAANNPDISVNQLADISSRMFEPEVIDGKPYYLASVTSLKFDNNDLIERGAVPNEVREKNDLPRSAAEKDERITNLLAKGELDGLREIAGKLQQHGVEMGNKSQPAIKPQLQTEQQSQRPSLQR